MKLSLYSISFLFILLACNNPTPKNKINQNREVLNTNENKEIVIPEKIKTGAEQPDKYLHLLKNKKVGLVVNHTAIVNDVHLLDFLLSKNIDVKKIFAPEHGFRGDADRGAKINSQVDKKTGIHIVSLFGKNRKPQDKHLTDLDIVIFDIQDVGVRFFTYISTMHNVMEACAENNIQFIVFDRPNPNGDYVAGPIRENKFKSFVGMHPIPIVHGLTVGELAQMINGEGWLRNSIKCNLKVIKVTNYTHETKYEPPVKPSPNLPNYLSIRLYPSLCFFEATKISVGRGTQFPFQVIGYPDKKFGDFTFVPKDIKGMQMNPIQEGKTCYGSDLRNLEVNEIKFSLQYVIEFYQKADFKDNFFSREKWFNLLAGNDILIKQIKNNKTQKEIIENWKDDLNKYIQMRKKYLLYNE